MSEKLIREIAISIVQEGLLENWKFYGLIFKVSVACCRRERLYRELHS